MKDVRVKVTCGALVVEGDSFLAVQEAKEYCKGKWNIPAGHPKLNEDLFTSIIREVKEETNIDIQLTGLLGIYQHKSVTGNNVVKVVFLATAKNKTIRFPVNEILNSKWMSFREFASLPSTMIRNVSIRKIMNDYHIRKPFTLEAVRIIGFKGGIR